MAITAGQYNKMWKLALFFKGPLGGWSESHWIAPADDDPPTTPPAITPTNWLEVLRCIRGLGVTLMWARMSRTDKEKEGYQLLTGELGPLPLASESPIEDINLLCDSLKFRLETAAGKSALHGIAGIRDSHIDQNVFTLADTLAFNPATAIPATLVGSGNAPTAVESYRWYMKWLLSNTCYVRRNPKKAAKKYTADNWAKVMFRKTAGRKLGRFFGTPVGRRKARV